MGMPRPADNTPNAALLHSWHGALGQVVCLALAAAYDSLPHSFSLSLSLSCSVSVAVAVSLCRLLCIWLFTVACVACKLAHFAWQNILHAAFQSSLFCLYTHTHAWVCAALMSLLSMRACVRVCCCCSAIWCHLSRKQRKWTRLSRVQTA